VGDSTVVVRDIQDPANAQTLCTFDPAAQAPQFVSATRVAYETANSQIISADLTTGATTVLATYGGGYGSGQYSISPDGGSVTYLDGNSWRLQGPSGNEVLASLPPVPGRGFNLGEDDSFLRFSPDGQYLALFQTFHTAGAIDTAPDQIRRASDGSLVYSTSGMTMAVWSTPNRLYFRDSAGNVHRWDPASSVSAMLALHWILPQSSPDGRWIAYTFRAPPSGLGGIGFYSVQSNSVSNTSPPGRSGVKFLNSDLVWYLGERTCSTCIVGTTPTGATFIYDIAGASEVTSRLASVLDSWPH